MSKKLTNEQKRAMYWKKYNERMAKQFKVGKDGYLVKISKAGKCSVCGHNMRDKSKPCKECERVKKSRRFIRGHNFGKNQRSGGASR
tara:strand:- start:15 stop:275 length:261 start_codon:yes stop_codon:yes gene_type:complete